jgi:hypothetical protein
VVLVFVVARTSSMAMAIKKFKSASGGYCVTLKLKSVIHIQKIYYLKVC